MIKSNPAFQYEEGKLTLNPIISNAQKPFIDSNPIYEPESNSPLVFYKYKGNIPEPNFTSIKDRYQRDDYIYFNTYGDKFVVVEYNSPEDVLVYFFENNYYKRTTIKGVRYGHIHNPYHLNKFGCYLGEGPFEQLTSDTRHMYYTWYDIQRRCYTWDAYSKCFICDEWRNFQNFAKWYVLNMLNLNKSSDIIYTIDKDIKQIDSEYKIYSPTTCMIIPKGLNSILAGIYRNDIHNNKENREKRLKEKAIYYYGINAINIYDLMYIIHNFKL